MPLPSLEALLWWNGPNWEGAEARCRPRQTTERGDCDWRATASFREEEPCRSGVEADGNPAPPACHPLCLC